MESELAEIELELQKMVDENPEKGAETNTSDEDSILPLLEDQPIINMVDVESRIDGIEMEVAEVHEKVDAITEKVKEQKEEPPIEPESSTDEQFSWIDEF